jgi:hypothetical protein
VLFPLPFPQPDTRSTTVLFDEFSRATGLSATTFQLPRRRARSFRPHHQNNRRLLQLQWMLSKNANPSPCCRGKIQLVEDDGALRHPVHALLYTGKIRLHRFFALLFRLFSARFTRGGPVCYSGDDQGKRQDNRRHGAIKLDYITPNTKG